MVLISELLEVYKGLGYREVKEGVVSRGGVHIHHGGIGCEVSNLGYLR